jgi:beta-lactamase class A
MMTPARFFISLITVLVAFFAAASVGAQPQYPSLRDHFDPALQKELEWTLTHTGLADAVKRKQIGLALVDITDPAHPRTAAVNGDKMFYAASLPKIAILLGAFVEIEKGGMRLDPATRFTLTKMIRVSSNQAASEMLSRVGEQRVADILQSPRYKLYDPAVNGGLWCGKLYGKAPAWRRDPLHNYSHGATAMQVAKFYYMLDTEQLVSPPLTRQMKQILSHPGIHHKFVKGLERSYPGAAIYRKSGSWRHWHSDSALVEHNGHKYVIVGLTEHNDGGKWLEKIAAPLHDLIVPRRPAGRLTTASAASPASAAAERVRLELARPVKDRVRIGVF